MALACLHPLWAPLAPPLPTVHGGSRIRRPAERGASLKLRSMSIQEQLKPLSKEVTTSRRDAVVFMTGISLAANTLLSADPAAARAQTASIGQQILDKLEMFKDVFGLSKPKGKDADEKGKTPAASPSAKENASPAKEEKAETKEEEKPPPRPTMTKEEMPKLPSPLNDSPKPLVDATIAV
ncbi:hypothetical protein Scep_016319 [Stephania cephalantha]|uniref:Uncharacterized protein n=1 Tax=Stephania cephalantha TaxID=152367 RepID=A0AAP0NVP1_9MAGN